MWIEGNYRRIFMDMHLDDWNDEFLSRLDPPGLVDMMKDAGVQQLVVKCRSHTGLAYFPTKTGRMHRGLHGRDYVGEMTELCHKNGIAVMAYFSQVFDNWAYENHPDWRSINGEGKTSREYEDYYSITMFRRGRYGIVCPNNEDYRSYVRDCLTELAENYRFESIFLDMPFWPEPCFCPSCRRKYHDATGRELPRIVDWSDPEMRRWQALREEWMAEFAALNTSHVKKVRPEVTIEHNMAVATAPWQFGSTDLVAEQCDYVGGDLYGGYLEQTFICKYYRNLSKALPFVYITSRCDPDLSYHTTTKSEEELLLHTITALVHDGAFSICDGMNPSGTMCESIYRGTIKNVFAKSAPYEKHVGGHMHANVAIWFSSRSKYDLGENGNSVCPDTYQSRQKQEYLQNPLGMTRILREENIPFTVIPSGKLAAVEEDLLVIPGVVNVRDEEMKAIEDFLGRGGNLYISGHLGHPRLLELLEAEYEGRTGHNVTYMRPTEAGRRFFADFDDVSPMAVQGRMELLAMRGNYELLATITLPYTMTGKKEFSAIHSNPPGIHTDRPAAILKNSGGGKIFWTAAPIEGSRPYLSRKAAGRIVRELSGELKFSSNAPSFVEILNWTRNGTIYFAAINQQEASPLAIMTGIEITVPYRARRALMAEGGEELPVRKAEKGSVISLPPLEIFHIFRVETA
ncbi:MAG: alpha-L-fucosidase [Treponema sp.]|jgi:hypothetical protein|nr:alpha-L-fucosidase [Treponema sp.]